MRNAKSIIVRVFGAPACLERRVVLLPETGQVLTKVFVSGVDHPDLDALAGNWPIIPVLPFFPGHEGAGILATIGAGAEGMATGEPLGIAWQHYSDSGCEHCTAGWDTLCPHQHLIGYSATGCPAGQTVERVSAATCQPWGEDSSMLAPILCAAVTTYKGLLEIRAHAGEWIVVSGIDGLGYLAIQYAKSRGLQVAALDGSEAKLTFARALGADLAVNVLDDRALQQLRDATGGGAHGGLVTGLARKPFRRALDCVRRHATVCVVHLPNEPIATPAFDVALRRMTFRSGVESCSSSLTGAIAAAATGNVTAALGCIHLDDARAA